MSEAILTFQSQLSGVMETVFKAAMFEITRLVEDSFLEEVSRSREQVESLKKRLQLSESRRKERENVRRMRCVNCGKTGSTENPVERNLETQTNRGGGLKQEEVQEDEWNSCGGSTRDGSTDAGQEPTSESSRLTVDNATSRVKGYSQPKEESLRNLQEHTEKWSLCMEEEEILHSSDSKCGREEHLQQCQEEWDTELEIQSQDPGPDREAEDLQGLPYRSRYSMDELGSFDTSYSSQVLDMGDLDGLANSPTREDGALSYSTAQAHLPADLGVMEEGTRRTHASGTLRGRRGTVRGTHRQPPANPSCGNTGSADLNCFLINEDGYLEDPSAIYQNNGEAEQREHGVLPSGSSLDNPEQMYAGDPFSHTPLTSTHGLVQRSGREERLHTCSQCLINFPDARSLKAHMQSHRTGSSGRYSCNQCGKSFTQACNLKVHQRIHQGEGLHLCSHCGKGFSSFSDLQKHHCSHAVDKPYCCSLCGNKFSRLWNLKLHRRIHTQEKPHCCTLCDKSFTRADILKVHYRTHTGERPYCCTVCGLSFKRLDHLKSHQRKHRPDLRN
ncbi:zinc finger protein 16 [Alosa sapidissima]|uniref:zinc finger protein 16 n=1 Tax=Alosa sapidissima TaxID=34773 RepID=UPI001C088F86|nr:zinc finger protein 16 [Alosa sapidissima]